MGKWPFMIRRVMLVGLLVCISLPGAIAQSFSCPSVKPALQGAHPYKRSDDGSRCEGFYQKDIAGPYLELLSLIDMVSRPNAPGEFLRIRSHDNSKLVVVLPLPQGIAYRADLAVSQGVAAWDPADMLKLTGLKLRHLGFLALATSPDDRLVLSPVTIGDATSQGRVMALIRTSVPTLEVRWRSLEASGGSAPPPAWQSLSDGKLEKWGLAQIEFSQPAKGSQAMTLQVQAKATSGELLPTLEFKVLP